MRTRRWLFIICISAIHLLFFFLMPEDFSFMAEESQEYLQTASNLKSEGMLYAGSTDTTLRPELYTKRTPVYPLLLWITNISENSDRILFFIQSILSILSMGIIYNLFVKDKSSSIPLLVFILFSPIQFLFANIGIPVILLQFILVVAFYFLFSYLRGKNRLYLWLYQCLLIVAVLTDPLVYLFILPNILFFFFLYQKYKKRLSFISSLLPLVFIIIFAGENQQRTGYFHISSIQQENRILSASQFQSKKDSTVTFSEARNNILNLCESKHNLKDRTDCINKVFLDTFRENYKQFLAFEIENIFHSLTDQGGIRAYHNEKDPSGPLPFRALYLIVVLIALLKLIGTVFYLMNKSIRPGLRLIVFLMLATFLLVWGGAGESFRILPAGLFIAGASAYQYGYWIRKLTTKRISNMQ